MSRENTKVREPYRVVVGIYQPTNEAIKAINNQTYGHINIKTEGESAPKLYNSIIKEQCGDVYVLIDGDCVLEKTCIETVIKKFEWSQNQLIGAVYSDCFMINPETGIKFVQYYPSYNKKMLHKNIINPYIFINGGIITEIFNETLETLYFYDALLKISANAMLLHVAHPLYTCPVNNKDIAKDLEKLKINVKR